MQITLFSILSSFLWVSIFVLLIEQIGKQMLVLRSFSIYPLVFLLVFALLRIFFPFELFYARVIRSEVILPVIQRIFSYRIYVLNLSGIGILIWVVVALRKFYLKIREYRRLYHILNSLPQTEDTRMIKVLEEVQRHSSRKKPIKIVVHEEIKTPAIVGFLKPIIMMPALPFCEDEILGIITHEWMHYYKKHIIYKFCGLIIHIIFWWNPFIKQLDDAIAYVLEMHADQGVSLLLNKRQQHAYLNAITKVIRNQAKDSDMSPLACYLIQKAQNGPLEKRFRMLLEGNYSNNKEKMNKSILLIPLMCAFLILSYTFVLQPYTDTKGGDYGRVTEIPADAYLVVKDDSYTLYNGRGEILADNIKILDDALRQLEIRMEDLL